MNAGTARKNALLGTGKMEFFSQEKWHVYVGKHRLHDARYLLTSSPGIRTGSQSHDSGIFGAQVWFVHVNRHNIEVRTGVMSSLY